MGAGPWALWRTSDVRAHAGFVSLQFLGDSPAEALRGRSLIFNSRLTSQQPFRAQPIHVELRADVPKAAPHLLAVGWLETLSRPVTRGRQKAKSSCRFGLETWFCGKKRKMLHFCDEKYNVSALLVLGVE